MSTSRRTALGLVGLGSLAALAAGCASGQRTPRSPADHEPSGQPGWVMPDEAAEHAATWMSYGVRDDIWGARLAVGARDALVAIANAISAYEPVRMLVTPGEPRPETGDGVVLIEHTTDDLWIRDTGPNFVTDGSALAGVDFNFNGWGGRQEHADDATVARFVCQEAGVKTLRADLVLEGGALEVDGEGTAILTESCVLNDNRNPDWTRDEVEAELARTLGITKVIWLPGLVGQDITDGHTDFYVRFVSPGVVVAGRDDDPESPDYDVTRTHLKLLASATDTRGRPLDVRVIPGPTTVRDTYLTDDFAAGYINFYLCNGAVIAPEFGDDEADEFARSTLATLFPTRTIVQLNIDPIAAGGGGIHCATQQQPRLKGN